MSITQLFFRKGNFIDEIEFDAVIVEGASSEAEVTSNPVEQGADMNDHIILQPMIFTVNGVVSNSSTNLLGQFVSAVSNVLSTFTDAKNKAQEAWDGLLEVQANRTIFTLVQGLKEYRNVVIKSLSETQDKDTSNALFFTAVMQTINMPGSVLLSLDMWEEAAILDMAIKQVPGGFKQLGSVA